jgi:acyl carrier protein
LKCFSPKGWPSRPGPECGSNDGISISAILEIGEGRHGPEYFILRDLAEKHKTIERGDCVEETIKARARKLLAQNFQSKAHLINQLPENADFVQANLFDSFEFIKVIAVLEKEFTVTIEVADLANDRISTFEKIEQFVTSKRPAQ